MINSNYVRGFTLALAAVALTTSLGGSLHAATPDQVEGVIDRKENRLDRKENRMDRRENVRDAAHQGGKLDKVEDVIDRKENRLDRKENRMDRRENVRDAANPGSGTTTTPAPVPAQ